MKIKVVQKMIAVMCAASMSGSCVFTTVGALDDRELVAIAQEGPATDEDVVKAKSLQEQYDVAKAERVFAEELVAAKELEEAIKAFKEQQELEERKLVAVVQGERPVIDRDVEDAKALQEQFDKAKEEEERNLVAIAQRRLAIDRDVEDAKALQEQFDKAGEVFQQDLEKAIMASEEQQEIEKAEEEFEAKELEQAINASKAQKDLSELSQIDWEVAKRDMDMWDYVEKLLNAFDK